MISELELKVTVGILVNVLMELHKKGAPKQLVLNEAAAVLLSLAFILDAEDETRAVLLHLGRMLKRQKAQKLAEEGQGQTRH